MVDLIHQLRNGERQWPAHRFVGLLRRGPSEVDYAARPTPRVQPDAFFGSFEHVSQHREFCRNCLPIQKNKGFAPPEIVGTREAVDARSQSHRTLANESRVSRAAWKIKSS